MKYISYLFLIFSIFSCDENNDSNIEFRIKNNLGEPITRAYLGSRISKSGSSYSTKSYQVKWTDLEDGELTSYKRVKGKFWGYTKLSLEFFGENKQYPHSGYTDEAVAALPLELVKDSVVHPYSKKVIERDRLPDGKYTLVIEGYNKKVAQQVFVKIIKD